MLHDRRKSLRFNIPLHVKFKPSKEPLEKYALGTTINFSRRGFCFETQDIFLEPEETFELKVMLPLENAFVPVIGEIAWKKQAATKCMVGIKLIEMNKEAKWEILDYGYMLWLSKPQGRSIMEKVVYS